MSSPTTARCMDTPMILFCARIRPSIWFLQGYACHVLMLTALVEVCRPLIQLGYPVLRSWHKARVIMCFIHEHSDLEAAGQKL
jgi:hypothetical protein